MTKVNFVGQTAAKPRKKPCKPSAKPLFFTAPVTLA